MFSFFFQSADRGSLTLSLCQQPTAGHLHVIIMKATGLPPPKSDAPGGLGKLVVIYIPHNVQLVRYFSYYLHTLVKVTVLKTSLEKDFKKVFILDNANIFIVSLLHSLCQEQGLI